MNKVSGNSRARWQVEHMHLPLFPLETKLKSQEKDYYKSYETIMTRTGDRMIGTKFWKLKSNRFCTTETLKQLRSWKHQVFLELEVQVELKTKGFVNICLRIIL